MIFLIEFQWKTVPSLSVTDYKNVYINHLLVSVLIVFSVNPNNNWWDYAINSPNFTSWDCLHGMLCMAMGTTATQGKGKEGRSVCGYSSWATCHVRFPPPTCPGYEARTHTHTHTRARVRVCACTHALTHTHAHVHARTHARTHTVGYVKDPL